MKRKATDSSPSLEKKRVKSEKTRKGALTDEKVMDADVVTETTLLEKKPTNHENSSKTNADENKPTKKDKARTVKSSSDRWTMRFLECKEYRDKQGHCKIPTSFKENKSLGIWVQEQRRGYKKLKQGEKSSMTEDRIEKLNGIGFHWGWTPDPNKTAESDASWEANFEKLSKFKETHGNFDVPVDKPSWAELGKWTMAQRFQHNLYATKRKTFMTKKRINKLKEIGFNWDGPRKLDK